MMENPHDPRSIGRCFPAQMLATTLSALCNLPAANARLWLARILAKFSPFAKGLVLLKSLSGLFRQDQGESYHHA